MDIEKLKQKLRKLKEKHGIHGDYFPSKVEVIQEIERFIQENEE